MTRIAVTLVIATGVLAASFVSLEVEIGANNVEARISKNQALACDSDNGCDS